MRVARLSLRALRVQGQRTLLAASGVALGVASVIVLMAIGESARREVVREIEGFGARLLLVKAGKREVFAGRRGGPGAVQTLKLGDVRAIAASCASVVAAVPVQDEPTELRFGTRLAPSNVVGTTAGYLEIRRFRVASGRFFTEEENRASQRVVVLGARARRALFGEEDPIGEILRIDRIPFEIVGVLEAKGRSPDGADEDDQVVIPLRTALRRVFQKSHLKLVYVEVGRREQLTRTAGEVAAVLRERHGTERWSRPDDFVIQRLVSVGESELQATRAFTRMTVSVAAVAWGVGGLGILSTMWLAVRERRSEIGLCMAIGARRRDLRRQFLLEAMLLGLAGGLGGVAAGTAGALAIGTWTRWATSLRPEVAVVALLLSGGVGVVFGVVPATRAATLDPIEALRGG